MLDTIEYKHLTTNTSLIINYATLKPGDMCPSKVRHERDPSQLISHL